MRFTVFEGSTARKRWPVANPYVRLRHRLADGERITKVAVRAHPLVRINAGNHTARTVGARAGGLIIHHAPYRSVSQARAKLEQGRTALKHARGTPEDMGSHWRAVEETLARLERQLSSPLIDDPLDWGGSGG